MRVVVLVFVLFIAGCSSDAYELDPHTFRGPVEPYERGLNLVFYADGYGSFDEFASDIDALMNGLATVEPWSGFGRVNTYTIMPRDDLCSVARDDERKPVLRCEERINRYLNELPLDNFKLIVLSRQEFQSWANIVRYEPGGVFYSAPVPIETNEVDTILFTHLMGHVFGLKDEEIYVLARAGGAPHTPDGPNCAPDERTAREWWGHLEDHPDVGYFTGCAGSEEYVTPTQNSVMNLNTGQDPMKEYGPVSEEYLRKVLTYCYTRDGARLARDDLVFFDRYPSFRPCLT